MSARRQLGLFGDDALPPQRRARAPATIIAAPVTDADHDAAQRLPRALRLGTSSWSFPGWNGLVYDGAHAEPTLSRDGLAAYARHPLLRTVGVDRTHYQPLSAEQFRAHAQQVGPDFRFVVKAHEWCTLMRFPKHPRHGHHAGEMNPTFLDPAYATQEVIAPMMEGLGDKVGLLLFQVAPQPLAPIGGPEAFLDSLHAFLDTLPRAPAAPAIALELRNRELLGARYRELLRDTGAIHCLNAHPLMPALPEQWHAVEADRPATLLIRWMLHAGLEYDQAVKRYQPFDRLVDEDPATRAQVAQLVLHAVERGQSAFVIVNNKAEGSAPRSVFALARDLARENTPD